MESEQPLGAGGRIARKFRLANGLGILLLRDPSAPLIAYQTWFGVGSRHEREGKTGIAHLFEHLMFNQTEQLAPGEFDRRLEAVGAETNAATWVDWTFYRNSLPREQLALVAELEADRMAHLVVHDPQVTSEREVVANERRFRVEDDVDGFLSEQLYRLAYTVHPYRWPTIGWMADIEGITTEDARAFYHTYYAPNNATLVLVGDFEERAALDLIERHYGTLPSSNLPAEERIVEPPQTAERRELFIKPVATERLLWGWRGPGLAEEDHPAVEIAVEILASGQSSRLVRRLVIETEIASSLHMSVPEFRDPGLVELRVILQRGHSAVAAKALLDEEIDRLAATAPDEEELEKAKCRIEARFWHSLRPHDGKAEALGHYQTTTGDYRRLFRAAERVRAVAPAEVQRVVAHYLDARRRTIVTAAAPRRKS